MEIIYSAGVYASQAKGIVDQAIQAINESKHSLKIFNTDKHNPTVEKCDLYFCHSEFAYGPAKRAKELNPNVKIVLQRDSAHPVRFFSLLQEEEWLYEDVSLPMHYGSSLEQVRVVDSRFKETLEEIEMADGIILASDFEIESFLDMGVPRSKLYKVPFTVDSNAYKPIDSLSKKPIHTNPFTIIFCGGDKFRKGLRHARKVVDELKNEGYEIRLISEIPHHQINKLYWESHCFLLPTIEDGNPVASLEAISCGLPTIVSKYTGTKDLVENDINGWVVPPRDIETIKEKIKHLYNNREKIITMGDNGRTKILKWQWSDYRTRFIESLEKIYEKV